MQVLQIHAVRSDYGTAAYDRRMAAVYAAPRCHHVKSNGNRCGSPALRGRHYCYFHQRVRRPRPTALALPPLEDANAVQCAVMHITDALLAGQLDRRTAGLLLYAMQIASANLKRVNFAPRLDLLILDENEVVAENDVAGNDVAGNDAAGNDVADAAAPPPEK